MAAIPPELGDWSLTLAADGNELGYEFDAHAERTGVPSLLQRLAELGVEYRDLETRQTSLEDIFVKLVGTRA
jgi:ABC-2 type transport system ATP-binding protein